MNKYDSSETAAIRQKSAGIDVAPIRGILWREWMTHRSLVSNFLAAWLICGWFLPIFYSPAWILAFGVIYALVAGPAFGGMEVQEGSEEFSFSLPPTRSDRYLVRLLFGASTVLGFVGLGDLAIVFNLPQTIWGLFFESGFTNPFPDYRPPFMLPLSITCPLAVFTSAFALSSMASTQKLVSSSWVYASLCVGAALGSGFLCENLLWQKLNGWIAVPVLLAMSVATSLGGYRLYQRKEGVSHPGTGGSPMWIVWTIVLVLSLLLLLIWLSFRRV